MSKRVYSETVKKWLTASGITVGTIIGGIFIYLAAIGAIEITGYSGDTICAGTTEDPCYAYINFTANEDVFIYPTDYDPWGRNTTFNFDPGVKSWILQRSWGTGWRTIPLDKSCTGTWCGLSSSSDTRKFSVAFREGRNYQIRIVAYKNNPSDSIKWGAFDIDPTWLPGEIEIKDWDNVYKTYTRTIIDKQTEICTPVIDAKNASHTEDCYWETTYKEEEYQVQIPNTISYNDKIYTNSYVNEKEGYVYICSVPVGGRNWEEYPMRQYEINKGVCRKVSILK